MPVGAAELPVADRHERLAVGGLGPQGQLRAARRERLRLVFGDGTAPLDGPSLSSLTSPQKILEERARASLDLRELVVPEQGDELLAERPCRLLAGDVALDA